MSTRILYVSPIAIRVLSLANYTDKPEVNSHQVPYTLLCCGRGTGLRHRRRILTLVAPPRSSLHGYFPEIPFRCILR